MVTWLSQIFGFFREFQCWIVIAPWEQGLRVRLGKVAAVLQPGPHPRIPFFDRIFVQSVRQRTISEDGQTITTKDGKTLTLNLVVTYSIRDLAKLYMSISNPEVTLLNRIQGVIAEEVSKRVSTEITPKSLTDAVQANLPAGDWGLADIVVGVSTFAIVRTYRVIQCGYRSTTSANDLEPAKA